MTKPAPQREHIDIILDATETVVVREGLAGLTIAAIVAESGVSTGVIYRRFGDKQGLLRAVKHRSLRRIEKISREFLLDAPADLRAIVSGFVRVYTDHVSRDEELLIALAASTPADEAMQRRGEDSTAQTFDWFRYATLRAASEITHPDPDLALRMAFSVIVTGVVYRVTPSGSDIATSVLPWTVLADEIVRVVMAYLTS
jgi:AcrR family transcriptional regulator